MTMQNLFDSNPIGFGFVHISGDCVNWYAIGGQYFPLHTYENICKLNDWHHDWNNYYLFVQQTIERNYRNALKINALKQQQQFIIAIYNNFIFWFVFLTVLVVNSWRKFSISFNYNEIHKRLFTLFLPRFRVSTKVAPAPQITYAFIII